MLTVSVFVEFVRVRPRLVVWLAALTQAALWTLVPALFYAAPPGQLAETLAVGHEFRFATYLGPPLAYWLAELAYGAGGLFGVYLLAQICVVVTYWVAFSLGGAVVGPRHAALAVLMMAGVFLFTAASPEFGPATLAMALWALALLQYWRAAGQGRLISWPLLGIAVGLLLLTSYAAWTLLASMLAFMLATRHGRAQLAAPGPWVAGVFASFVFFPQLIWLDHPHGFALAPAALALRLNAQEGLRLWGELAVAHFGLAALLVLWGLPAMRRRPAPTIERAPVDPAARAFVFFFALTPAVAMGLFAMLIDVPAGPPAAPLAVLSGLAVMAAAPDRLRLVWQRALGYAWAALVVLPPLLAITAVTVLPWLSLDFAITHPAAEMGRFFGESFERRTGRPLAIVAGDAHTAALVALAAASRPSLYLDAAPERKPWVSQQDIVEKGAVVVWPTTDMTGTPPPEIKTRFPDLVPDPPRAFARPVQGFLPPVRIGWGVIRPRSPVPSEPAR